MKKTDLLCIATLTDGPVDHITLTEHLARVQLMVVSCFVSEERLIQVWRGSLLFTVPLISGVHINLLY